MAERQGVRRVLDVYELIELQVEALFTHDAVGRIVRNNEPNGPPAVRFFLGRTAEGNLWRLGHDVPTSVADRLASVAAREPVDAAIPMVPHLAQEMLACFDDGTTAVSRSGGPAFYFGEQIPTPSGALFVDRSNASVLEQFAWLVSEVEERQPCFAVVRDGIAVSICISARRTGRAAEAGIDTLDAYRGNGYVTTVTAAWALAVRAEGLVPLYSTSWENAASRGVARRLGLVQYGVDWSVP